MATDEEFSRHSFSSSGPTIWNSQPLSSMGQNCVYIKNFQAWTESPSLLRNAFHNPNHSLIPHLHAWFFCSSLPVTSTWDKELYKFCCYYDFCSGGKKEGWVAESPETFFNLLDFGIYLFCTKQEQKAKKKITVIQVYYLQLLLGALEILL